MTWFAAFGSFLKSAFAAIPFLDKWFGDHSTVEDHIKDSKDQNAKDVADEIKKGRPGKPWFVFLLLMLGCSSTIVLPGDKIRYLIDTNGAICEAPPILRANTADNDNMSVMDAHDYFVHSPAVEVLIRDALTVCQDHLHTCRKK